MDKISQDYCVISPAYGRDYKSKKEAVKDFFDGKDFKMETLGFGGRYCSIQDFEKGVQVEIRYKALGMATMVTVK